MAQVGEPVSSQKENVSRSRSIYSNTSASANSHAACQARILPRCIWQLLPASRKPSKYHECYPTYPQYPSSDPNTGYPPPPQPQVYSHDAYSPLQPTLPQASHVYNVPNTPVYNTQGQPIQQGIPYGLDTSLRPPVQPTPTAAPRQLLSMDKYPLSPVSCLLFHHQQWFPHLPLCHLHYLMSVHPVIGVHLIQWYQILQQASLKLVQFVQ